MREIEVVINGRFMLRPVTGVERVAREIITELDERCDNTGTLIHLGQKFKLAILTPDCDDNAILPASHCKNIPIKKTRNRLFQPSNGHLWEQFNLAFKARNQYLVNLCNSAPLLHGNQSVFVHDAAIYSVPDAYTWKYRVFYKTLYKLMGFFQPNIMTNSEFSKSEIVKRINFQSENITVFPLGAEVFLKSQSDFSVLTKNNLVPKGYVLAVASAQSNKNFSRLIKALALLGDRAPPCAIVGSTYHPSFKELEHDFPKNSIRLGRVSDEQLKALYTNAIGLIFPSLYEGFGLPPLEAISCGTIPVVSNTASLPEVCGPGAIYCDPLNVSSIAQAILQLINLTDDEYQSRLSLCKQHIRNYSWSVSVNLLLDHIALNAIEEKNQTIEGIS